MAEVIYVQATSAEALKTEVDELLNSTSATYALSGNVDYDRPAIGSHLFTQTLSKS